MRAEERIIVVGTSHISKQSQEIIKKTFLEFQPDVIAVELDYNRLHALKEKNQKLTVSAIREIGFSGYIFAKIGRIVQKRLGKTTGVLPGEEMLLCVDLAKNNSLILALIDQDIRITMRNLSKKVPFREKMRIFLDIVLGPLRKTGLKVKIDLHKIPEYEVIDQMIALLKKRYPALHKVLIEDRNHFMAKKTLFLLQKYPEKKIMAVMGAGHKKEVERLITSLIQSNVVR